MKRKKTRTGRFTVDTNVDHLEAEALELLHKEGSKVASEIAGVTSMNSILSKYHKEWRYSYSDEFIENIFMNAFIRISVFLFSGVIEAQEDEEKKMMIDGLCESIHDNLMFTFFGEEEKGHTEH